MQSFDEYVVGYRDSRDVIDLSGAEAARRGTPGLPSALMIVDGQIAGRWLRRVRAAQVDVEVALHRPFGEAEAVALQAEVDRHAAALGRSATLITSTGVTGAADRGSPVRTERRALVVDQQLGRQISSTGLDSVCRSQRCSEGARERRLP